MEPRSPFLVFRPNAGRISSATSKVLDRLEVAGEAGGDGTEVRAASVGDEKCAAVADRPAELQGVAGEADRVERRIRRGRDLRPGRAAVGGAPDEAVRAHRHRARTGDGEAVERGRRLGQ